MPSWRERRRWPLEAVGDGYLQGQSNLRPRRPAQPFLTIGVWSLYAALSLTAADASEPAP